MKVIPILSLIIVGFRAMSANSEETVDYNTTWDKEDIDELRELLGGLACYGPEETKEYHTKEKKKVEDKLLAGIDPQEQDSLKDTLVALNLQLGCQPSGVKKPQTCWTYVRTGSCRCRKGPIDKNGSVYSSRWHPGPDEREYLKSVKPR